MNNYTQTVLHTLYLIQNKPKNTIIHLNHGLCYLSFQFINILLHQYNQK